MGKATGPGGTDREGQAWIARLADTRGLERAYALDPMALAAAIARAGSALGSLPSDFPAASEPALAFDPLLGAQKAGR